MGWKKTVLISLFLILATLSVVAGLQERAVIITGADFSSYALGQGLSAKTGAEIVITKWGALKNTTLQEVRQYNPKRVIILDIGGFIEGGEFFEGEGISVDELNADTYAGLSALVGLQWNKSAGAVFVEAFDEEGAKDALKISTEQKIPIFYVEPNEVSEDVRTTLKALNTTTGFLVPAPDMNISAIKGDIGSLGINLTILDVDTVLRTKLTLVSAMVAVNEAKDYTYDPKNAASVASSRIIQEAQAHINVSQQSYNEEDYSVAFAHAVLAKRKADDAKRIQEGMIVGELKSIVAEAEKEIGVIVLTSDNPADYAVAEVLARRLNASVVTTPWGEMSQNATKAVEELGFKTIYVVGGETAIPDAEEELKRLNVSVLRFGGEDRFETSSLVAATWGNSPRIILAQGFDRWGIPDAAKEAAENNTPLVYIRPGTIPESVENLIIDLNVSHALLIPSPDTEVPAIETILQRHAAVEIDVKGINKSKRAGLAIEAANKALIDAIPISTEDIDAETIASSKLLALAKEDFVEAQDAYDEGSYSRAFAHALAALQKAENAGRILSGQIIGRLKELVEEAEGQLVSISPYQKVSIGELVLNSDKYTGKGVEVEGRTRSPPLNIGGGIYIQIFDEAGRTAVVKYSGSDIGYINIIKKDDKIRARGTVSVSAMFGGQAPGPHGSGSIVMIDAEDVEILSQNSS